MSRLFINLPVADLSKATAFYTALGCTQNKEFSDTNASAMVYDDNLSNQIRSRLCRIEQRKNRSPDRELRH